LTKHFEVEPMSSMLLPLTKSIEWLFQDWTPWINARAKSKIYLDKIPFSDFKFFEKVIQAYPKLSCKSATAQPSVMHSWLLYSIEVYCNRGTSGIDGSTSTAIGAAVNEKQTVFIRRYWFYNDSNALEQLHSKILNNFDKQRRRRNFQNPAGS
jgi:2-succinyl-5-enolpyruvyl-6-hydroxy-3-cyclohexene-1-carboxylate synthase